MNNFYKFVIEIVKIFKPKHKNWVVSTLLISGLGMVSQPWWIPYLNIALDKVISSRPEIEYSGWFLIMLSIAIHFVNRIEDYFQNKLELPDYTPIKGDIQSVTERLIASSKADLLTFIGMPGSPQQPEYLNLRNINKNKEQILDVSDLAAEIKTTYSIAIIAPPGTGKTTTLLQLAGKVLKEGVSVAIYIPLSDWSTYSNTFFEYILKIASFAGDGENDLRQLANSGKLILILDGWNELDTNTKKSAVVEIKCLRRNYADIRFIISTRKQAIDVPNIDLVMEIEPLTQDQQLSIARKLLGPDGEELLDQAWRKQGISEIVAIPLYLTALLKNNKDGNLPTTKEEVLHQLVTEHEKEPERKEVLRELFCECHKEMLTAIAIEMTVASKTTLSESKTRSAVSRCGDLLSEELRSIQPMKVIDGLVDLHMLVQSGSEKRNLSFQHQQFQEWYASFKVEELVRGVEEGDKSALTELSENMLDVPFWEEAILFTCERLSRESQQGIIAVAKTVIVTMAIEPMFSAEMIYRSSDAVWEQVKIQIRKFIEKWHSKGRVDRAFQFMMNTGRADFAPYIWPLISDDNDQIHLQALRAGRQFRPSVLGSDSDIHKQISVLPEPVRVNIISTIAGENGMDGIKLATKLAREDKSSKVKVAVIESLQFRRADRFVTEILHSVSDDVWSILAKKGYSNEIVDPEASKRLQKEQQKLIEAKNNIHQKINMVLYDCANSPEIGV
ncbi:MAG: hypothetical protein KUG78_13700 [Kangiellaceae bacterium]|nr:hypothetical protein [Kangiellaceae bacterium]